MKVKKLQLMMNPNLKIRINHPGSHTPWEGECGRIPQRYLDKKIFSLNPSHISTDGTWEYDCIDIWVELTDEPAMVSCKL